MGVLGTHHPGLFSARIDDVAASRLAVNHLLDLGHRRITAAGAKQSAILNAEGIHRCHVVGHSMGGLIAMQLALTSPRRVKTLALLCTFPDGKSGSRLTRDTFITRIRTRIGTKRMRRNAFL